MFDEPSLKAALAQVGYHRVKRHVYRADWSTDIEHFVYFHLYGTPKEFLSGFFGIRNKGAESFAMRSIETYGPELHRLLRDRVHPDDCTMSFSLGRMASWGIRDSLTIPDMSGPALAAKIKGDVEQKLLPLVRDITTFETYLSLLLIDTEPVSWIRTNGAIRTAIIVYLARRLGLPRDEIHAILQPHHECIADYLQDAPISDPRLYIERLIDDAGSALQSAI